MGFLFRLYVCTCSSFSDLSFRFDNSFITRLRELSVPTESISNSRQCAHFFCKLFPCFPLQRNRIEKFAYKTIKRTLLGPRVSKLACYGAAPAPGIFFLEPAPSPAPEDIVFFCTICTSTSIKICLK